MKFLVLWKTYPQREKSKFCEWRRSHYKHIITLYDYYELLRGTVKHKKFELPFVPFTHDAIIPIRRTRTTFLLRRLWLCEFFLLCIIPMSPDCPAMFCRFNLDLRPPPEIIELIDNNGDSYYHFYWWTPERAIRRHRCQTPSACFWLIRWRCGHGEGSLIFRSGPL